MAYYNKADSATWVSSQISGPQASFLEALVRDRVTTQDQLERFEECSTKAQASKLIGELKKAPFKNAATPKVASVQSTVPQQDAKPGYYVKADRVFKVVISKASGKPYAKEMIVHNHKGSWEYAPGIARELSTLEPLTAKQAGIIGKATGACMICGRTLTHPDSVAAGIGPICGGKL